LINKEEVGSWSQPLSLFLYAKVERKILLEGVFVDQVAGQVFAKNGIIGGEVHVGTLDINDYGPGGVVVKLNANILAVHEPVGNGGGEIVGGASDLSCGREGYFNHGIINFTNPSTNASLLNIGDGGIFLLFAAGSGQGCYSDDGKDNE
jgi:hypothetical protein